MSVVIMMLTVTLLEAVLNALEAGVKAVRDVCMHIWMRKHYKRTFNAQGGWKL